MTVIIMLLTSACNTKDLETYMEEVDSTDLSGVNIDGIEVNMSITDETFLVNHGYAKADPENEHYLLEGRKYDQYWINQLLLGVDRETKEILSVAIIEDSKPSSNLNGIKIGDNLEEVISEYGDNFYKYEDTEQSISIMGYVDHSNNLNLTFIHSNNKVIGLSVMGTGSLSHAR